MNYMYLHHPHFTASSMTNHRTFTDLFLFTGHLNGSQRMQIFTLGFRLEQIREDRFLEMEKQFLGQLEIFIEFWRSKILCILVCCEWFGWVDFGRFWTSNFICPVRSYFFFRVAAEFSKRSVNEEQLPNLYWMYLDIHFIWTCWQPKQILKTWHVNMKVFQLSDSVARPRNYRKMLEREMKDGWIQKGVNLSNTYQHTAYGLMVQKSGKHQLRLVVYPMIYKVLSEIPTVVGLGISEPSTVSTVSSVKVSFKTTSFSASFMSFFGFFGSTYPAHIGRKRKPKRSSRKLRQRPRRTNPFRNEKNNKKTLES